MPPLQQPNEPDTAEPSLAPVRIVFIQTNRIYGNNKYLYIYNGHAPVGYVHPNFTGTEVDAPHPCDIQGIWRREPSLDPTAPTIYLQNNWIYGANRRVIIALGPGTVPVSPQGLASPATYEQNNHIFGNNGKISIHNGRRDERVLGQVSNLQNNWISGDHRKFYADCGNLSGGYSGVELVTPENDDPIMDIVQRSGPGKSNIVHQG